MPIKAGIFPNYCWKESVRIASIFLASPMTNDYHSIECILLPFLRTAAAVHILYLVACRSPCSSEIVWGKEYRGRSDPSVQVLAATSTNTTLHSCSFRRPTATGHEAHFRYLVFYRYRDDVRLQDSRECVCCLACVGYRPVCKQRIAIRVRHRKESHKLGTCPSQRSSTCWP